MKNINELVDIYLKGEYESNDERINEIKLDLFLIQNIDDIILNKLSALKQSIIIWKNDGHEVLNNRSFFTSRNLQIINNTINDILISEDIHQLSYSTKSIMNQSDVDFHQKIIVFFDNTLNKINNCDNSVDGFIDILKEIKKSIFSM